MAHATIRQRIYTKKRLKLATHRVNFKHSFLLVYLILKVELAGVEPASKQGNHTLSTRLFQPSIFV